MSTHFDIVEQAMQAALEFGLRYGNSYGNSPLKGERLEKWNQLVLFWQLALSKDDDKPGIE